MRMLFNVHFLFLEISRSLQTNELPYSRNTRPFVPWAYSEHEFNALSEALLFDPEKE